jgi:hypothetical protein
LAADDGFPCLSLRAWPEHHGGSGDTVAATAACAGDMWKRRGSGCSELQPMPRAALRGKAAGRAWLEAGIVVHGRSHAGDARMAGSGEGIGGRSREGLTAGPHVAVSEREREREKNGG